MWKINVCVHYGNDCILLFTSNMLQSCFKWHQIKTDSDHGWAHGVRVVDDRYKFQCRYCNKTMSGGIYWLKQHLAHISRDTKGCTNVPTQVRKAMRSLLLEKKVDKKKEETIYQKKKRRNNMKSELQRSILRMHVNCKEDWRNQLLNMKESKLTRNDEVELGPRVQRVFGSDTAMASCLQMKQGDQNIHQLHNYSFANLYLIFSNRVEWWRVFGSKDPHLPEMSISLCSSPIEICRIWQNLEWNGPSTNFGPVPAGIRLFQPEWINLSFLRKENFQNSP